MNLQEIGFIIMLGVIVAFYLIFIRPAQQEQKRHQATIRDLSPGDDVITTAGFFARIKEIHTPEEGPVELVLDFGGGVEVRSLITAVAQRVSTAEAAATERPEGTQEA
jgi:preprotein translocase subunit YajC